jgi:CheY-like chemotaxis protein
MVTARDTPARGFSLSGDPLYVLVAEDNGANQLFLKTALKKIKIQCDIAQNGRFALEMASTRRYDLILMDCQMPVMDGFAATGEIRKLRAPFCDVPIIALTANASAEDKSRCMNAGMNDFLAKPIMLEELWRRLRRQPFPAP